MIIVLKQHAPDEKVKAFCNELQTMGYQINDSMGSDTHILGLIGKPGGGNLPPCFGALQKGKPQVPPGRYRGGSG